jgi:hypothetical protein
VSPKSFEEDFQFMKDLGYSCEIHKKGRFRPANFWKTESIELTSPPVHKDRTLLTSFRRKCSTNSEEEQAGKQQQQEFGNSWYVLNCHLQAGKQAQRRVRQINEGVRAVMTLARKQKGMLDAPMRNVEVRMA